MHCKSYSHLCSKKNINVFENTLQQCFEQLGQEFDFYNFVELYGLRRFETKWLDEVLMPVVCIKIPYGGKRIFCFGVIVHVHRRVPLSSFFFFFFFLF